MEEHRPREHGRRVRRGPLHALASALLATSLLVTLPSPAAAAPTPTVTIGDLTVTEGTGGTTNAVFTIQVAPPPKPCCSLQVSWATAAGTATTPEDFTARSGSVTLSKSATSRTVTVPVIADTVDESNETFVVNLSGLVGSPGTIGDAQGVATITDDDPLPVLTIADTSVTEGDVGTTPLTFTVTLSPASGKTVTVDWATADDEATQPDDYATASGTVTFLPGDTSETATVDVTGDGTDEIDETFGLSLSAPTNATIGDGSGTATILDDDPFPVLTIADASVTEGNVGTTPLTFTVTLSPASGKTVTVVWATADDEATQPADYTAASGTLTFLPGDTSETATVDVASDGTAELDETFRLNLSSSTNATLSDAQAIGIIVDDEMLPVIDIDDPVVAEGSSGSEALAFTVSLSNPSALPVTVDWASAAGTATSGGDYLDASGTVSFAPLDTSESVTLTVNGDGTYETDETVVVDLSNALGAPIGDTAGTGTISNDDSAPVLSVTNASVAEGDGGTTSLSFVVALAGDTEVDASVDFATADATATAGSDYASATGTLTIPAGSPSGTVVVDVNGDSVFEADESFLLTLTAPADASIGDGSASGSIVNDDVAQTTITLTVLKKARTVSAKGILEPTKAGHKVSVTLFRKQGSRFVRIAAKKVTVASLRDRDGDGLTDGSYAASFGRPRTGGTYKIVVKFKGSSLYSPCSRSKQFTLAPR